MAAASCAAWSAGSRSGKPTSSATAGSSSALRDQILPEIIRRRRGRNQCLRIWSAGCSTGEEPYSLAILVRELLADIGDWKIHILATDINEDALAAAREGIYRNWSFREVEEHYRQQYFTPEGESSRIRPEVQSMVSFRYLNLADDRYPTAATGTDALDLILCRNVMIYFPPGALPGDHPPLFRLPRGAGLPAGGPLGAQRSRLPGLFPQFHRPGDRLPEKRPEPGLGKGHRHPLSGQRPAAAGDLDPRALPAPGARGCSGPPGPRRRCCSSAGFCWSGRCARPRRSPSSGGCSPSTRATSGRCTPSRCCWPTPATPRRRPRAPSGSSRSTRCTWRRPTCWRSSRARPASRPRELALLKKTVYLNPDFVLGHFQIGPALPQGAATSGLARRSLLNALRILKGRAAGDPVEGVEGMTVGRLRETVLAMIPGGGPGEADYRNWSFREVEEHYRQQYFTAEGDGVAHPARGAVDGDLSLPQPRRRSLPGGGYRHGRPGPDPLPQRDDLFPPGALPGDHAPFFRLPRGAGLRCWSATRSTAILIYPGFSRSFNDRSIVYQKNGPNPVWEKGHRHPLSRQRLAAAGDSDPRASRRPARRAAAPGRDRGDRAFRARGSAGRADASARGDRRVQAGACRQPGQRAGAVLRRDAPRQHRQHRRGGRVRRAARSRATRCT